jgi:hypothetical protein
MNLNEVLWTVIREQASRQSRGMNYAETDGSTLLSSHVDAANRVLALTTGFDPVSRSSSEPITSEQVQLAEHRVSQSALVLGPIVHFSAVMEATTDEIFKRTARNGVNRNFAMLKIGHQTGNLALEKEAYRQLKKIGMSICWNKGWHHPDGPDEWESILGEVLARELNKVPHSDPLEVFSEMLENRFAYVYRALEFGFYDEWRKLYRRPDRIHALRIAFDERPDAIMVPPLIAGDEQALRTTIKLVEMAAVEIEHPGASGVLRAATEIHNNYPHLLEELNQTQLSAQIVKSAARTRGVSERQARSDLKKIASDVDSKDLWLLRDRLQEVDSPSPFNKITMLGRCGAACDLENTGKT